MRKEINLERRAMDAMSDQTCDAATKRWLVMMNVNSPQNLRAVAAMNSMPSVSMAAFSKIREDSEKASILIGMFSSSDRSNLVSIGYEVISGMKNTSMLWDIFQAPGVPKELKPHIERRIGLLAGTVEPKDYREIIRLHSRASR